MTKNQYKIRESRWFISRPKDHYPRLRRSLILLATGTVISALGYYLISNDLPDVSIRRAQILAQWIPMTFSVASLFFGIIGVSTAAIGVRRIGLKAIDLDIDDDGIIIRDGQKIPWHKIESITDIEYQNNSKVPLLWSGSELQRALIIELKDDMDARGGTLTGRKPSLKIDLLRYPAAEYSKRFEAALAQFTRHGIPVEHKKKWKQT